ncbi:MAG: sugar diacid recognition domain-containing protein [Eubacteriales bacterium]|nr:sugar diacid recognition domain-containing protein [Eubacteriales bacterium]
MILEQIADELVEVTSGLVSGRTINVMNLEGIIIASSEKERVGTFHQGAMQVVRTGRTVNITREQVANYPGAREGCNMPIRRSGRMIGVVGIYGNPEEIQDLAHLLGVYTAKYLELETIVHQRMEETEIRKKLFQQLLTISESNREYAMTLMDSLQLQMQFPLCAMVFSAAEKDTFSAGEKEAFSSGEKETFSAQEILEILQSRGFLDVRRDLYLEKGHRLILLKSRTEHKTEQLAAAMYQTVREAGCSCRVSLGSLCSHWEDIRVSCQEACGLDACGEGAVNCISDPQSRCSFMIYLTAQGQEVYVKALYGRLQNLIREEELPVLLETAECYYRLGRSVSKASEQLFIHKNTLQYRLRRLLEAMEVSGENGFCQEFLVRLILQYVRKGT